MQKKSGVMQSMEVHRSWPTDQTVPPFLEGGGQGLVKIYWLTTRLQVWLFGKIYGAWKPAEF